MKQYEEMTAQKTAKPPPYVLRANGDGWKEHEATTGEQALAWRPARPHGCKGAKEHGRDGTLRMRRRRSITIREPAAEHSGTGGNHDEAWISPHRHRQAVKKTSTAARADDEKTAMGLGYRTWGCTQGTTRPPLPWRWLAGNQLSHGVRAAIPSGPMKGRRRATLLDWTIRPPEPPPGQRSFERVRGSPLSRFEASWWAGAGFASWLDSQPASYGALSWLSVSQAGSPGRGGGL